MAASKLDQTRRGEARRGEVRSGEVPFQLVRPGQALLVGGQVQVQVLGRLKAWG